MPSKRFLEQVFRTGGVPEFTFVEPPNFNDIFLDLRTPGKPLIIEGQSGTGKTTCVTKALDRLGAGGDVHTLNARKPEDLIVIRKIISDRMPGTFLIDDFHRLDINLQQSLGDLAKIAAEQPEFDATLPKLVLIGINQIGSELIHVVPDLAKRLGIHKIQAGRLKDINHLIESGCRELNIKLDHPELIYQESQGDYWLSQQLCQTLCSANGITETTDVEKTITVDLADLRSRVVTRLRASYHEGVKEFCRGTRFRPSNDPYFKLLKAIGEQVTSTVDLEELANSNADVRGSINNIKAHRLNVLLSEKPICEKLFYYNSDSKNFAIEDPALFYYIKHLSWDDLRTDCGFRIAAKNYDFDFAISFAGINRELAKCIADNVEVLDASIFFDEYFETNFLGKAWNAKFQEIFAEKCRLVVCLLDNEYLERIWPTFERECFLPRVPLEEVIPIYLDDTKFVGIPSDTVGIKYTVDLANPRWQEDVIDKIVFRLLERLD
ncbi:hypothetical protein [Granulicella arctica]|uniref:AAA+ ATPase domain-containing protein n=1 Tax=Granulicella arctica TaxID=940613 RepID=A0A7Y9PGQ5_9BACT|nr:hypothetical protein [Granulicella arctica]NYF78828.1 hypothetical protein [Granulicella arctica]